MLPRSAAALMARSFTAGTRDPTQSRTYRVERAEVLQRALSITDPISYTGGAQADPPMMSNATDAAAIHKGHLGGLKSPPGRFISGSVSFLLTLTILAPARADPLQIHGTMGYVGEYELNGNVSAQDLNGTKEFSGPLTVRHIGICTHDGPKETIGKIRFELAKSSSIAATLDFYGSKCAYKGMLSESYHGFMDCGREGSLPLRLWTK